MTLRNRKTFSSNLAYASTLALLAACLSGNALALDLPDLPDLKPESLAGSYYGGLGFGSSGIEPEVNQSGYEVTDSVGSGMQLFLGRDISPRISVEGYYSQMGEAELSNPRTGDAGQVDYSTVGVSGLLYLLGGSGTKSFANRAGFAVYGRVGFGNISNEGIGLDYSRSNGWRVSTGLGAEYNMRNGFGLRAEFHNFDSDARVVSLNIVKRFSVEKQGDRLKLKGRDEDLILDEPGQGAARPALKDADGDGVSDKNDDCSSTDEGTLVDASGCEFVGVIKGVTFTSGSAKLSNKGKVALDRVIGALKLNPQITVSVEAHTDNQGSAAKNMALSRKRAESVVLYLAEKGRIDLDRIAAVGYGESRPLKSNRTVGGRKANRRVEIKIDQLEE